MWYLSIARSIFYVTQCGIKTYMFSSKRKQFNRVIHKKSFLCSSQSSVPSGPSVEHHHASHKPAPCILLCNPRRTGHFPLAFLLWIGNGGSCFRRVEPGCKKMDDTLTTLRKKIGFKHSAFWGSCNTRTKCLKKRLIYLLTKTSKRYSCFHVPCTPCYVNVL